MSDTHDLHKNIDVSKLPEADIFVHAGDFTQNSYRGELNRFIEFLDKLPYKHKIVIAGNHDFIYDVDIKISNLKLNQFRKHLFYDEIMKPSC